MYVYKVSRLLNVCYMGSFYLSSNLSSSMSVIGDVSDTLVSLWLPVACGDHLGIELTAWCHADNPSGT